MVEELADNPVVGKAGQELARTVDSLDKAVVVVAAGILVVEGSLAAVVDIHNLVVEEDNPVVVEGIQAAEVDKLVEEAVDEQPEVPPPWGLLLVAQKQLQQRLLMLRELFACLLQIDDQLLPALSGLLLVLKKIDTLARRVNF